MRAAGAGIAEEFLDLLRVTLRHYGVPDLEYGDSLERAVLRLFASQRNREHRRALVLAMIRRVIDLSEAGVPLGGDASLAYALSRIAAIRGLVSNAVADVAIEAGGVIFERPVIEEEAAKTTWRLEVWLSDAERSPTAPPEEVLEDLVLARRRVFNRVSRWIADDDARRSAIAQAAYLRRIYAQNPTVHTSQGSLELGDGGPKRIDRLVFPDGRVVLGCATRPDGAVRATRELCSRAREEWTEDGPGVDALEVLVAPERESGNGHGDDGTLRSEGTLPGEAFLAPETVFDEIERLLRSLPLGAGRLTVTVFGTRHGEVHRTWAPRTGATVHALAGPPGSGSTVRLDEATSGAERIRLTGLHPEAARRLDLQRFAAFELERLQGAEGIVTFFGRSRDVPEDERIFVLGEVRERPPDQGADVDLYLPSFEHAFHEATRTLRGLLATRDPRRRLHWNRVVLVVVDPIYLDAKTVQRLAPRLAPATRNLGLEKVIVRVKLLRKDSPDVAPEEAEIVISDPTGNRMEIQWRTPHSERLMPAAAYERKVVAARRRGLLYPYEIIRMLTGPGHGAREAQPRALEGEEVERRPAAELPGGDFVEYDVDVVEAPSGLPNDPAREIRPVRAGGRPFGQNQCGIVFGVLSTPTEKHPEGMKRVIVLSDPTIGLGSLAGPECDRVVAALDLAEQRGLPVEWLPVSSGARISMSSGTENLDATARVVNRIVRFTQGGGVIHLIVLGVNVGAQSYWDALATMLMHTRGVLIMGPRASMVLTGRAALEASGSVSAEDEVAIAGFERIMGPNGQAQYFADDLASAYRTLYEHYAFTYVAAGDATPRLHQTADPRDRRITDYAYPEKDHGFTTVGDVFDDEVNPGRKRPFSMRALMSAVIDQDGGSLERWQPWVGAQTAITWDAHLGGHPVCLIGIESQLVDRWGYRPTDGPQEWNAGTLFPNSSKKIARALNAASGNRPVVVLANLTGFDGSPESMRKIQLEYGAEIARAVVNFDGPILFLVVSRYHGGAYVVFSRSLNPRLRSFALEGSYASVIGGAPAAAVVFPREVRGRAAADERVTAAREAARQDPSPEAQADLERIVQEVTLEHQSEVAKEFDAIHSVERALDVGSLERILAPADMRPFLIAQLDQATGRAQTTVHQLHPRKGRARSG